MKVRALVTGTHYLIDEHTLRPAVGQYGRTAEVRHRPGDIFELQDYWITIVDPKTSRPEIDPKTGQIKMRLWTIKEQFNPRTMEKVPEDTPESYSTAQDALNQAHDELLGGRVVGSKKRSRIAELNS